MNINFENLRGNAFLKWFMTAVAGYKIFTFVFLAIPAIWNEPISSANKLIALAIGALVSWAFCYVALQFWK